MTDLLATCWTSAGDVRPGRTLAESPIPFEVRVEAVAGAGFVGLGLELADLDAVDESIGFATAGRILAEHGITFIEVEFLNDWWLGGDRRRESDGRRARLFRAAAELGAHHVKLGSGQPGDSRSYDELVEGLAGLAEEAAAAGTRVAIETGAGSALDLMDDVLPAVRAVSDPAVGVLLDPWHFVRSRMSFAVIDDISAEEIVAVELSDGAAEAVGSFFDDTFDRRLLPGEGGFDVLAFIEAVRRTGWSGVWGVEVMSDELRRLPIMAVLERSRACARGLLDPRPNAR